MDFGSLFGGGKEAGGLGLIAALLTVVFAIVYLVFLGKAKKMLKEN
jgi:hypothetical protein